MAVGGGVGADVLGKFRSRSPERRLASYQVTTGQQRSRTDQRRNDMTRYDRQTEPY